MHFVTGQVATVISALMILMCVSAAALAEDKDRTMKLGKVKLSAPEGWEKKQPKSNITRYEFHAPAAKGEEGVGRLTAFDSIGGSIEDNLKRWYGQFKQPDGGSTKDRAKIEKKSIGGIAVHLVEIAGTFSDQSAGGGDNYRLLGAILETKEGNLYLKFTGPQKTVTEHEKAFRAMVADLKAD